MKQNSNKEPVLSRIQAVSMTAAAAVLPVVVWLTARLINHDLAYYGGVEAAYEGFALVPLLFEIWIGYVVLALVFGYAAFILITKRYWLIPITLLVLSASYSAGMFILFTGIHGGGA